MVTHFLATVIGWYLVILSFLLFFRYDHILTVMKEIIAKPGEFFIIAVMTLILGLLLVTSHNIWVMDWPVVITLFSWVVLVAGILRLFVPEMLLSMWQPLFNNTVAIKLMTFINLLIGLFLLYHVYYLY